VQKGTIYVKGDSSIVLVNFLKLNSQKSLQFLKLNPYCQVKLFGLYINSNQYMVCLNWLGIQETATTFLFVSENLIWNFF